MKNWILTALGVVGSFISGLFGGWTTALTTLVIFMGVDYITGLIVAGVFHKSPKTTTGTLESRAGFKGLLRKFTALAFVLVGYRLDLMTGQPFVKDAVCIFYICNEALSIVENAGLMGLPIPNVIKKAIDLLHNKEENHEQN